MHCSCFDSCPWCKEWKKRHRWRTSKKLEPSLLSSPLGCSSMPKSSKVGLIKKYMLCLHVRVPPKNRNGKNASLELISLHQTIKGDPNDGLDELEPDRSYLNHFPTWCAKCIHSYLFPCRFFLIKWANHISVDRTDINWDKNLKLFFGGGPHK